MQELSSLGQSPASSYPKPRRAREPVQAIQVIWGQVPENMEVTCDRCNADYEFEEALISLSGTTVKCTSCGHLFKVHRDGSSAAASAPAPAAWSARGDDGRKTSYDSLKAIAQAIKRRELTRDSEISKTGKAWRKLGEIDELRRYFTFAESCTPKPPPPPRGRPPSKSPPVPKFTGSGGKPSEAAPRFEALGETVDVQEPSSSKPRSHDASASADNRSNAEPDAGGTGVEEPLVPTRRPGTRALLWITTLVVPALVLAGFLVLSPIDPRPNKGMSTATGASIEEPGVPPIPNRKQVGLLTVRADSLLASHDPRRFPDAISDYEKALETLPNDAHILSSLSRVYARWSQLQRFQLDDFHRGDHPLSESDVASLKASRTANATAAKEFSIRAARKNPGNEEAEIALADALRLNGNLVGARTEIDRALRGQAPNSEALRVASLLAVAEAGGKLGTGQAPLKLALQLEDSGLVNKVLWFRIQHALGHTRSAKRTLAELRADGGDNPVIDDLQSLLPTLGSSLPKSPPTPPRAPLAPASPEDRAAAAELNSAGENLLEDGQPGTAERKFKQALQHLSNSPRARTGLGYVALERNRPRRAVWHFQAARKAGYAEALIGLGEAYRALGRVKAALRSYRRYLALHPNARSASIAARQITLLKARISQSESPSP